MVVCPCVVCRIIHLHIALDDIHEHIKKDTMKTYAHLILGTGQATGTLLARLIPTGESIAVIEGGSIGGSCVNFGCTPTKTLVASAWAVHNARRGQEFGFEAGDITIDFDRIRQRMNDIRYGATTGLKNWMQKTENVTLYQSWGAFTGPKTIRAGEEEVTADNIYINTGTRAVAPPIPGIEDLSWLDSGGVLDLESLPDHLVVIGGGYIGVEFSQIFRRFGSKVTLLQRDPQLMPNEDQDVAEAIREILEKEGVDVHLNADTEHVSGDDSGVEIKLKSGYVIQGSHLLMAAGRRPNSDTIDPEQAGLTLDNRGFISVDDYCRTGTDGVFAIGDVNGRGAFTHTSVNDAEVVLDYLFGGDRTISQRHTIYGLFTDPPLGRVGLTEKQALDEGRNVLKVVRPMSKINRAKEMGETQGFAKILVDGDTDQFIGASVLGPGGDEIINMFAVMIHSQIPCREYRKAVMVHPTVSELMPWTLDNLEKAE